MSSGKGKGQVVFVRDEVMDLISSFLTSTLEKGEPSDARPSRFLPCEIADVTHWTGRWEDLRTEIIIFAIKMKD
jgi:hypothetical protein